MSQDDFDIYLASGSPRRQELLDQIGIRYRTVQNNVAENPEPEEAAGDFALRIAIDKVKAARKDLSDKVVLSADTVVCLDDNILGKPRDQKQAIEMLRGLSGRQHQVLTAVAVMSAVNDKLETCLSVSEVTFRELHDDDVNWYWQTGEPVDKAGAYAIQGKGAMFIRHLAGSYSGVMGLPLYETAELLRQFGINTQRLNNS